MSTILVVDDSLADQRLASGLLTEDESLSVEYANDGKEALEQIELHIPDLVLTDLQMPVMDGLELVEQIRKRYPLIPTVLMTAKGSETIAVQALQRGAASYVPKRYLSVDLIQTVHRVLAASAGERSQTRLMNRLAETKFVLENDLSLLSSLVSHLRQTVQQLRICDGSESLRVASGLDEALLNAYYHGNLEMSSEMKADNHEEFHRVSNERVHERPYCDRRITVTSRFIAEEATFIIRDEGAGFDPSGLPDPTDPEYLDRPTGRGLLLMRSFMDNVTFNETGNEVTLVKRKKDSFEEDQDEIES